MSLLFFDGFERINTAQLGRRGWTIVNSSGGGVSVDGSGLIGNGLNVLGQSSSVLPSESMAYRSIIGTPVIITGFSFMRVGSSSTNSAVLRLMEGSTTHVLIAINETGTVSAYRGDGTLLGQSATFVVNEDSWSYIEIEAFISNSVGYVIAHVDDEEILNLTGKDTRNGGAGGTIDRYALCCDTPGFPAANRHRFDDVYALDDAGAELNERLGPVRVDVLGPTANSGAPGFTPSAGSNYQCVDETTPNDDTDYNETLTDGAADDFVMANLPDDSLTIFALQSRIMARRADAGAATVALRLTSGATLDVAPAETLSESYEEITTMYTRNPDGEVEWDDAAVDGIIPGYERPA